ncbi:MAG: hypothetical protein V4459_08280 [Pseudomonadota bacterium]
MTSVDLIVLMIAENGLRSALAARLTMQGENVLTLSHGLDDPELERLARHRAIMIADLAMLDDRLASILADSGWHRVVLLNGEAREEPGDRVIRLQRRDAVQQVAATLAKWRAATPAG